MHNVDQGGYDDMDRVWRLRIMEKYDGGHVAVDGLAAALSEERGTIEDVLEPYLIQQGYLMRSSRGRMATRLAYEYFGLKSPKRLQEQSDSLDDE